MLAGSGIGPVVVPMTPVLAPGQLSQMISTANGDAISPGGFTEFSTSCITDEKPPTRVTVKVNDESVPAPPPELLNRTPYSKFPNPSILIAFGLDSTPPLTSV